jgi:hypothetical protein
LDSSDNIPFTKVKGRKAHPKGDSRTCSINGQSTPMEHSRL